MKAKSKCEICGFFTVVGFTDCGLICEKCFSKELQINAFNEGVEKSAQRVDENFAPIIRQLKMETHRKDDDTIRQK